MSCEWLSDTYMENRRYQDALWEEGKPVEVVWCSGKCSGHVIHFNVTRQNTTYENTDADKIHPFVPTGFTNGSGLLQHARAQDVDFKMM